MLVLLIYPHISRAMYCIIVFFSIFSLLITSLKRNFVSNNLLISNLVFYKDVVLFMSAFVSNRPGYFNLPSIISIAS